MNDLEQKILNVTLELFQVSGLDFTMSDVAKQMHISKKTIYRYYRSKEELLLALLNHGFANIQEEKKKIINSDLSIAEKLERVMIAMPQQYAVLDFRVLATLNDIYPELYRCLNEHLENDWEPILELIDEGIRNKEIKTINTFILRQMVTATFQQLLSNHELKRINLSYTAALKDMMDIIMKGIVIENAANE